MTNHKIQFVGGSCGQHGNYTFYKAFRYSLHGKQKILSLGEFFFVKIWEEEDIINIGEAQLLWEEKTTGQVLVSLRLYFLPENTPEGRCEEHGEHEVVSLSEKVVLRAEDVINIMRAASGVKWEAGLPGIYGPVSTEQLNPNQQTPLYESPVTHVLDIKEILREKNLIGDVIEPSTLHVIVLGYDKYCRMRALLKRVEGMEEEGMRSKVIKALGGFLVPSRRTRLLFCRDVFDYPELEGHELLCNHLAPKLQGRPRKRRRADSESESSETSEDMKPRLKLKPGLINKPCLNPKPVSLIRSLNPKAHSSYSSITKPQLNTLPSQIKNEFSTPALNRLIEVDFMSKLYKFMKDRNTAITRVPYIGYRQLKVFDLFTRVQQMGGYEVVCQKEHWKVLYDEFSGKPHHQVHQLSSQNPSAGPNILRRHYERLLLPYENFLLQEQKKILNNSKRSSNKLQQQKHLKLSKNQHRQQQQQQQQRQSPPTSGEPSQYKAETGEPSVSILQVPKIQVRRDGALPADLAKRPEITITPIPRSVGNLGHSSLTSLQLADLMTLNVNLNSQLGVSALQDLAKIAERYDRVASEQSPKKFKIEDGSAGLRVNGASQRNRPLAESPPRSTAGVLGVPDLVSADILRQMNILDCNSKLLLPAHQSTKTINAIAALLPQTSIFPAPAPAAHQQVSRSPLKQHIEPLRPEPVLQTQSAYAQSKNIYGKPTADVSSRDHKRRSSPEIEILDLRILSENKSLRSKNDRSEIELLDLSTRKDITVSAVPKPGTSKGGKGHSLKIPDNYKGPNTSTFNCTPIPGPGTDHKNNPLSVVANSAAAASALGMSPGLSNLGLNSGLLHYMMSSGMKPGAPPQGSPPPMFPYMDLATLASYYSFLPPGLLSPTSSPSATSPTSAAANAAAAAAATAHQVVASQLAQFSSLGLGGLPPGVSPEALANLGIYKNYLPQGTLPAPHFLSGLMSPGGANPPTTK